MVHDRRLPTPLLWNVRIVDRPPREQATVEIEDGRIITIGDARGDPPAGALDCGGRTLLPGLIDAHIHLSSDVSRSPGFGPPEPLHGEEPRRRELGYFVLAKTARVLLAAGITTVRDVGCYDEEAIVLRQAVELGVVEGPRILSCARIISATSPGGGIFGTMYHEADGPWEMRRAVREQLRRGADYVKLMATGARSVERENPEPAQLTREEIEAVVDEAHRLGVRVAAHAEGLEGTRFAVEAGVDTVEHGLSLHREPRLLELMAERGIVLVPTLSTFHDLAERFTDDFPSVLVEQAKRQLDEAYRTLAAARDAGVVLAMGHDSGPPGANAIELVRMAEGGLGAAAAIEAATRGSARALGLEDEIGAVERGKAADLLIVDGDPLADVRILNDPARIWRVLKNGDRCAISSTWSALASESCGSAQASSCGASRPARRSR
ncbi:MAG: amidohydrolase family protein [Actinobacteria bacterium]|nr:MAG: amidohydrolase family protein [Actinomycetota bacterium]